MKRPNPESFNSDNSQSYAVEAEGITAITIEEVEHAIERRELRTRYLPSNLFSEPGWEMLMFLALRHLQQRRTTVSEACRATSAPYASSWRWLSRLIDEGLVIERGDPFNRRRKFVELTPAAFARVSMTLKMQQPKAA